MRKFRLSSVLAMLLSALLLITSLPMAAFAVTPSIGIGTGTPNYDKFRGNGMTADANGVMVYDDLAAYKKTSRKDMALTVSYETKAGNATNSGTTTSVATYDECSVLYADYAIYYDDTIEGNTVKIRYGLSMMDSVEYIDANGNIVKGDKSPIELSGSYKNNANPDWNAGYGMVYNETTGELEYTTRYYEEKAILFYIINHSVSERIGQEDDVSILQEAGAEKAELLIALTQSDEINILACAAAKEVKLSVEDEYECAVVTNECVLCLFICYECNPFNRKIVVVECITVNNDLVCIAYNKCIYVRNVVRICCAAN